MILTKHFTLEEFTYSATASRLKIDNTVPDKYLEYIHELANILEIIRVEYGKPIIISSGYRCSKLNKAVGGASTSQHMYGQAADIHTLGNSKEENEKLFELILFLARKGRIKLRQIIDEYSYSWIHIGINAPTHTHKENQVLHIK